MSIIPKPLTSEWDEGNVDKNLIKHNVSSKEVEEVFTNQPLKIFADLKHSQQESRFLAYGITNIARKLTIVFIIRNQKIRVISARDQNKNERIIYESKN